MNRAAKSRKQNQKPLTGQQSWERFIGSMDGERFDDFLETRGPQLLMEYTEDQKEELEKRGERLLSSRHNGQRPGWVDSDLDNAKWELAIYDDFMARFPDVNSLYSINNPNNPNEPKGGRRNRKSKKNRRKRN